VRLDERESDALAVGRREKGHPVDQCRIVLHVIELREALRRCGKARIGRDALYPVAVDETAGGRPAAIGEAARPYERPSRFPFGYAAPSSSG
jgi:hypothetical protein